MKDIDKSDAPLGYVAAEPIQGCLECAFDEDFSECFIASKRCVPSGRRDDKRDVIFKKENMEAYWNNFCKHYKEENA